MESIDEVNPVLIFLFYFCLDYPLPYFVKWLQCTGLHFYLALCFRGLPSNFKSGYIVVSVSINFTDCNRFCDSVRDNRWWDLFQQSPAAAASKSMTGDDWEGR